MGNVTIKKFQIHKPIGLSWQEFGKKIRLLSEQCSDIKNTYAVEYYLADRKNLEIENKLLSSFEFKNGKYDKSSKEGCLKSKTYHTLVKPKYLLISTPIMEGLKIQVGDFYVRHRFATLVKKEESVLFFKRTSPVPFPKGSYELFLSEEKEFCVRLTTGSKSVPKEERKISFVLKSSKLPAFLKKEMKSMWEGRLGTGECYLQIKDNKIFFLVSCKHPPVVTELDSNVIMGIDLGIAHPWTIAFSNSEKRDFSMDASLIRKNQTQFRERRRSIQRGYKNYEERKGRGRKKALEPTLSIENRESSWADTMNHKMSKALINRAIKEGAKTIQMENLSGITAGKKPKFLKNWRYFDLQTKIEYKAKIVGIKVVKINPQYTSQRCSECGTIHEDNRKTQEKFVCVSCGYTANADYNAAKNIATKDIENMIKEYCIKNKLPYRGLKDDEYECEETGTSETEESSTRREEEKAVDKSIEDVL